MNSQLKVISNDGDKVVLLDMATSHVIIGDRSLHPGIQRDQFLKDFVPGQVIETTSSYSEAKQESERIKRRNAASGTPPDA